jgi:hypothetical protein
MGRTGAGALASTSRGEQEGSQAVPLLQPCGWEAEPSGISAPDSS